MKTKYIWVFAAKVCLLLIPIIFLLTAGEVIYVIDDKVVKNPETLPAVSDLYIYDLIPKQRFGSWDYGKTDAPGVAYIVTKQYEKTHPQKRPSNVKNSGRKYKSVKLIIRFIFWFMLLEKLAIIIYSRGKKKEEYPFGDDEETVIPALSFFDVCREALLPSIVLCCMVWGTWSDILRDWYIHDTYSWGLQLGILYGFDLYSTIATLVPIKQQIIVSRLGIRGQCASDPAKSKSIYTQEFQLKWEEIEQAEIIDGTTSKAEDDEHNAYKRLVIKRPQGKVQNIPEINIDLFDEDLLIECINHYYAVYTHDPSKKLLSQL